MIHDIRNSDFFKNLLAMMKGTSIAQIILLLSYPIITRIFSPIELGIAGTYISIALILSILSTFRYEVAIVLPKSDEEAINVFIISLLNVLIVTLLTIPISIFLGSFLSILFEQPLLKDWLFLLPLNILFLGTYNVLTFWNNRKKRFKLLGNSRIVQNTSVGGFKISFGAVFGANSGFLIIGDIFGQFMSSLFLARDFFRDEEKNYLLDKKNISVKSLKKAYSDYINFPLFSLPMGVLNQFSMDMLVYILNVIFNIATVGLYTLAHRVVNFPLNFVSMAFSSVFFQKLNTSNNRRKIYLYSLFGNIILGIIVLFPLLFIGGELFAFVFGQEWFRAGVIAGIVTPLVIASYAVGSVSNVFAVKKKNELSFIWQVIYLLTMLSIAYFFRDSELEIMLQAYSIIGAILYLVLGYIGYRLVKDE